MTPRRLPTTFPPLAQGNRLAGMNPVRRLDIVNGGHFTVIEIMLPGDAVKRVAFFNLILGERSTALLASLRSRTWGPPLLIGTAGNGQRQCGHHYYLTHAKPTPFQRRRRSGEMLAACVSAHADAT